MAEELWNIWMEDNMRDVGLQIWEMEKVLNDIQMVIHTLDNLNKEKLTEKEFILGKMEKFMMENGTKAWNKDMVYGKV